MRLISLDRVEQTAASHFICSPHIWQQFIKTPRRARTDKTDALFLPRRAERLSAAIKLFNCFVVRVQLARRDERWKGLTGETWRQTAAPVFRASARSATSLRKQQEAALSGSRLSECECVGVSFIHSFKKKAEITAEKPHTPESKPEHLETFSSAGIWLNFDRLMASVIF